MFIHMYTGAMNPCTQTREDTHRAMETWACKGCRVPKQGVREINVDIIEPRPAACMNIIFGFGIGLIKLSLLTTLKACVNLDSLFFGEVRSQGKLLKNWKTFNAVDRVIVRGSSDVGLRYCDLCGRPLYYAAGKRYLYPTPSQPNDIHMSDLNGLIAHYSTELEQAVSVFRSVRVERLAVPIHPPDDLGIILPQISAQ